MNKHPGFPWQKNATIWTIFFAPVFHPGMRHAAGPRRELGIGTVFNFLGRVSFPVYLLHNTFIKSVLTWMIYLPSAMNPPRNEKGEQLDLQRGSTTHIFIAVAVFYYILYRSAALWIKHVDPICANMVNAATKWAYGEPQQREPRPILANGSTSPKQASVLPS